VIFEVRPGAAIGPFELGMTRGEVLDAAERAGLDQREFQHPLAARPSLQLGSQVITHFDDEDRLCEVETATARLPTDARIVWGAIDFGESAPDVGRGLDEIAEPDRSDAEWPGSRVYDSLGLALWQDVKPGMLLDRPYEAVLVRRPGSNT
jgi:hypothetical protein